MNSAPNKESESGFQSNNVPVSSSTPDENIQQSDATLSTQYCESTYSSTVNHSDDKRVSTAVTPRLCSALSVASSYSQKVSNQVLSTSSVDLKENLKANDSTETTAPESNSSSNNSGSTFPNGPPGGRNIGRDSSFSQASPKSEDTSLDRRQQDSDFKQVGRKEKHVDGIQESYESLNHSAASNQNYFDDVVKNFEKRFNAIDKSLKNLKKRLKGLNKKVDRVDNFIKSSMDLGILIFLFIGRVILFKVLKL